MLREGVGWKVAVDLLNSASCCFRLNELISGQPFVEFLPVNELALLHGRLLLA